MVINTFRRIVAVYKPSGVRLINQQQHSKRYNNIHVYEREWCFNWFVARCNQFMKRAQAVSVVFRTVAQDVSAACCLMSAASFPFMLVNVLILWRWKTAQRRP